MSRSVIVVDDEITWSRNLSRYLTRYDFNVRCAATLDEAEALLAEDPAALLYLDICLPDGDGIAFLDGLRASGDRRPCLLVSAHVSNEARAAAGRLDAEIIEKPTPLARLCERADRMLPGEDMPPPVLSKRKRSGPVILMYSHDGYGLGHMRRNLNIARGLVAMDPAADILMIIGCPSGLFFELPPQIDFIKLPSIIKIGQEQWRSSNLSMSFDATCALRAGMILHTAKMLRPDVMMVDYLAQGVGGELQPTLDWIRANGGRCKTVLGLRDIIDSPREVQARWRRQGVIERIVSSYDRVLLYGDEEMFDSADAYGLKGRIAGRLRYCGYVAPPIEERKEPGGAVSHVVVTAGGGRDGLALHEAAIRARRALPHRPMKLTIVTGPLMDPRDRRRITYLAGGDSGIHLLPWVDDISVLTRDADLVLTMAGYNSLTEILAQGHKPIVLPRKGPSREQRIRTRLFADRGLVDALDPEGEISRELAEIIERRIETPQKRRTSVPFVLDGAQRAASEIVSLTKAPLRKALA